MGGTFLESPDRLEQTRTKGFQIGLAETGPLQANNH